MNHSARSLIPPSRQAIKRLILEHLRRHPQLPVAKEQLLQTLSISGTAYPLCQQVIEELIAAGAVAIDKDHLRRNIDQQRLVGKLRTHPRGFGFVQPEAAQAEEVFIAKDKLNAAIDGDRVEVVATRSAKGWEGSISAILQRQRTQLVATVVKQNDRWVELYVPILASQQLLPAPIPPDLPLEEGDKVVIKIGSGSRARIVQKIGSIADPSCDVTVAVHEFGMPTTFSPRVVAEAKARHQQGVEAELANRKDLTDLCCITIDPESAQDFDDALSISQDQAGNFHLGVHIADVSHYVQPGSALDQEACRRGNSTYFPGICWPMLPEELSADLCSLRPHKIRLTVSVLMRFDRQGALLSSAFHRAYIKSRQRFTYAAAQEVLDGQRESPFATSLQQLATLCHLLKEQRRQRGNLEFELPETVIEVDNDGTPTAVRRVEYDLSHQIVENCMLKANEVVAQHLAQKVPHQIYRIHEAPLAEALADFYSFVRSCGFSLPQSPSPAHLQQLFDRAKGSPFFEHIVSGYIRSMKLAGYSPYNQGHYGLALEFYAHFTSPIRRYSDLITHRLLFAHPYSRSQLQRIASRCSDQERLSMRAESSVKTLKKLRLFQKWQQQGQQLAHRATILRVKEAGISFELQEFPLEGFLHVSKLGAEYFIFDAARNILRGKRSGTTYRIGQTLALQLLTIDLVTATTSWQLPKRRLASRQRVPR